MQFHHGRINFWRQETSAILQENSQVDTTTRGEAHTFQIVFIYYFQGIQHILYTEISRWITLDTFRVLFGASHISHCIRFSTANFFTQYFGSTSVLN